VKNRTNLGHFLFSVKHNETLPSLKSSRIGLYDCFNLIH